MKKIFIFMCIGSFLFALSSVGITPTDHEYQEESPIVVVRVLDDSGKVIVQKEIMQE